MNIMMRKVISIALLLFGTTVLLASSASALSLDEAKAQGLVGETRDGYIGLVGRSTPEAVELVERINSGRRAEFEKIAKKNGTALNKVEKLAAEKAIRLTPSGQYVQAADGSWTKK